ncbi:MAG TPA: hypothetical protein VJK30_02715 [Coxiellaceae bacterium]|nr:MAG: hypothetical protein A3E81_02715 [Gammaproteobacteria bacterium RIFCSPHIGHO2_12_FULL_36_30]HLB56227.1 hypothetical protein [Coxiellaceae bacterium]
MTEPHLTPAKLIGQRFPKNIFGKMRVAILGYCPPPSIFKKYNQVDTHDQYFILQTPDSVKKCSYGDMEFLHIYHIYGGPVSASLVEELAYYNFDYILAYGLAGGLGTKNLKMGDYFLIESGYVYDGTTPHYTKDSVIKCDDFLETKILSLLPSTNINEMTSVRAMTNDAIYKENNALLKSAKEFGCDIINLDSSHLYAASINNHENKKIKSIQCGVISNIAGEHRDERDSNLSVMLSSEKTDAPNPLELTGNIVEFFVEKLMPKLI